MNVGMKSAEAIRIAGLKALEKELGAIGMVRFLQQFELGEGDYTKEREELLKEYNDINKIINEIEKIR